MSISSSYIAQHSELIKKSINNYSFINEIVNAVNNYNFKLPALNIISGDAQTKDTYIWNALSNIVGVKNNIMHTDIQEEFADNIINFIDNVANIDICKIKALQSMIQLLGINYNIFDKLNTMPITIYKLIDILSIKKEYLVNSDKMSKLFSTLLYEQISSDLSIDNEISNIISNLNECRLSSLISADNEIYSLSSHYENDLNICYKNYISHEKLNEFTTAIFSKVLSDFCYLTYNNNLSGTPIYKTLSSNYIINNFDIDKKSDEEQQDINLYRLKNNIPKSFNAIIEANKIEQGYTDINQYTVHEQHLINLELDFRYKPLKQNQLFSRYHYYRHKEVQSYFKFIENECADLLSIYVNTELYNIDNSFVEVSNITNVNLAENNKELGFIINNNFIDKVAIILTNIVNAIRDIREQIKTQVQKNFIKGTKLHLEYVIREYIRNNVYQTVKKILPDFNLTYDPKDIIININTYTDPTEYFNISTDIDQLSDNTNVRYWENDINIRNIAAFNTNDIFKKPDIILGNIAQNFTDADLSLFYKQILQCNFDTQIKQLNDNSIHVNHEKDQLMHLNKFLNNVFDSAADTTYAKNLNICCDIDFKHVKISDLPKTIYDIILNNINTIEENLNNIISSNDFITNTIEKFKNFQNADSINVDTDIFTDTYYELLEVIKEQLEQTNTTLSDLNIKTLDLVDDDLNWRNYKNKLFKKYTGTDLGSNSFANIKNKRHPSYQIHTYVKNLVNYNNFQYPIPNIHNVLDENILKYTNLTQEDLTEYINNDGKLINIWKNPLNTNTDYLTYYEKHDNKTELNVIHKAIGYEGLFHPEFIKNYKDTTNIANIINSEWYKNLNLTTDELNHISVQLEQYKFILNFEYFSEYKIYRYGKDFYNNQYFLLKSNNDDYGMLWMKIKNHPIAFPMVVFSNDSNTIDDIYSQIYQTTDLDKKLYNLNSVSFHDLSTVIIDNTLALDLSTLCVKDFTFSIDRSELMLIVKDKDNNDLALHLNIKKKKYNSINYKGYKFFMVNDNLNSGDNIENAISRIDFKQQYSFEKFYNFENCIGLVLINKKLNTSNCSLSIHMPFWDKYKLYSQNSIYNELELTCTLDNCDNVNNIKLDIVDNKKILNIAYIKKAVPKTVKNYLGYTFNYENTNDAYLNTFNKSIVTKEFKFTQHAIVPVEFDRTYIMYNDMGFIPLYKSTSTNNLINNISDKPYYKQLNDGELLKFNLIGNPNNNNGIFFKYVVPVRMHENYKNNLSDLFEGLSCAIYNDAKYSEHNISNNLNSLSIYDPYEFEQYLNTYNLSIRIDESFINDLNAVGIKKNELNKYQDKPYLYFKNTGKIENIPEFYVPGSNNATNYNNKLETNQFILKINDNETISVSWVSSDNNKYGNYNGIKLDFNSDFYKNNLVGDSTISNLYNFKHSFLNLDKPGAAGYLTLYNGDSQLNTYYIKNISDEKPKFILIKATNNLFKTESEDNYNEYILYSEDNTYFDDTDIDSVPIINEYKMGFSQLVFDK